MRLFFDLDGTILDVQKRHLAVYRTIAQSLNLPAIPDDEYWKRKQHKLLPWDNIPDRILNEYNQRYRQMIEDPDYLPLDAPFSNMISMIHTIKTFHEIILVTNRRQKNSLLDQLDAMNIRNLFDAILTPYPQSKADAMRQHGYRTNDIVIGDTEEDIHTAHELHIPSIAVSWGLRAPDYLLQHHPTFLCNTMKEIEHILWNEKS
ncbi:MAG: HAD family hydrolase [Patescibacteria group bacterium]|nr:HAD family hydrolase [Patescibacteria group bacterium]